MIDSMMDLRTPVEKTSDADILGEMISFAAEQPMEMEVGGLTAPDMAPGRAAQHESDRAAERRDQAPHRGRRHLPQ